MQSRRHKMKSNNGDTLQGVALTQGFIQLTSGTYSNRTTFHCHEDGDIILTFDDATTQTVSLVAGDAFPFYAKTIEISTGTFSLGVD